MSEHRQPLLMENMTVEDMRAALAATQTVLVPLGVTEQHGYHLPLSTDVHNARQSAIRVAAATGAVVAPPLWYSYSGGELPGTINVSPQVMALMVQEIVTSLAAQGFRNIVLLLGHAGTENTAAVRDLVILTQARLSHIEDLVIALAPVWEFSETWMQAFADHDYHAGSIETSLMMHWAPELVRPDHVEQDDAALAAHMREDPDNYQHVEKPVDDPHVVARIRQRDDIVVGVMGYPEKASADVGRRVCDEIVAGVTALVRKIESEKPRP